MSSRAKNNSEPANIIGAKIKFAKFEIAGSTCIIIERSEIEKLDIEAVLNSFFDGSVDTVAIVEPSPIADVSIRTYCKETNETKLSANSLCCVAKYISANQSVSVHYITADTPQGIYEVKIHNNGTLFYNVEANMKRPSFKAEDFSSIDTNGEIFRFYPLDVKNVLYDTAALVLGSDLHTVVFIDDNIDELPLKRLAPHFINHSAFTKKTTLSFVNVTEERRLKIRSFSGDSTELRACGTVACAVASASAVCGVTDFDTRIAVDFNSGSFEVICDRDFELTLICNARLVLEGEKEI